ncbi:MAG TPA: energy-coupling factor ABC transporter permease [Actinomycetota bacterium]|nr:energy-coupling factor ABC transporter permease [Actinomycetota bacterium]
MHVPDGFLSAGVSVATGAVSAGGIGYALMRAKESLADRLAPMAGLVAAFVFAVQMLNFPVAAGTSGHLLGGALACIMVGPWAGTIAVAIVLVVQALLFADGGLTALGTNVLLISIIPGWSGLAIFMGLRKLLPSNRGSVVAASFVAALLSVVIAAFAFVVLYAVGGTGNAPVSTVLAAMLSVHVLAGLGEGLITALTVGAVVSVRPDLVYGAQDLVPDLAIDPDVRRGVVTR